MTTRMLPPASGPMQTCVVNGRTYTKTPGGILDVPDFDVPGLTSNGWLPWGQVGTTAQRPTNPSVSQHYVDTTVSKVIQWDGGAWRDIAGSSV